MTWGRELEQDLPAFSAEAVFNNEDTRYDFLTTIRKLGIAIVTGMSKEYDAFERISSQIGLLRDMNGGKIFEIRPDPNREYLSGTSMAMDSHSDGPTRAYIPGFQLFQCVENTSQGGESFWVDAFHIVAVCTAVNLYIEGQGS